MVIISSSDVNDVPANIIVVCACLESCCCGLFNSILIDVFPS